MTCYSSQEIGAAHPLPLHMTIPLHTIGQGFCGTVWASGQGPAFKREDGGIHRSLKNDYEMHRRVIQCLQKIPPALHMEIRVPDCYAFVAAEDRKWWNTNYGIFPPQFQAPCDIIQAQRIPPFERKVRELLVEKYCPPHLRQEILSSEPNKDCLVRPYLGRRRTNNVRSTSRFKAFSLRNFPLHLDQLETLMTTNDIKQYARMMADTLAMMHWIGEIDGNDIEFVLAPPDQEPSDDDSKDTTPVSPRYGLRVQSDSLGNHSMWVLDFDLCQSMQMDSTCVEQVATAFWRNDPYYPRPVEESDVDFPLWATFKEQYLQTSQACIDFACASHELQLVEKRRVLPGQVISRIEQRGSSGILC